MEGRHQGTCRNDPWTWTTGLGFTVGAGVGIVGIGGEEQRGKNWDNYIRTIKYLTKKEASTQDGSVGR